MRSAYPCRSFQTMSVILGQGKHPLHHLAWAWAVHDLERCTGSAASRPVWLHDRFVVLSCADLELNIPPMVYHMQFPCASLSLMPLPCRNAVACSGSWAPSKCLRHSSPDVPSDSSQVAAPFVTCTCRFWASPTSHRGSTRCMAET